MCQNQNTILSKISDQITFVLQLANQLQKQLVLNQFTNQKSSIPKHLEGMITYLSMIPLSNDSEAEGAQTKDKLDDDFGSKTINQIIGIELSQKKKGAVKVQDNIEPKNQDHQKISRNNKATFARGPYRSYGIDQKLKVIKLYMQGKKFAFISRHLRIPQKNIVRWCRKGVFRKQGAGRKIGDPQMEINVLKWIKQSFNQGDQIKSRQIRNKAIQYSTNEDFKSSKGWLKNFIRRNALNQTYNIK